VDKGKGILGGNIPRVDRCAATDLTRMIDGLQFNGVTFMPLLLVGVWRVTVLAMPSVCFEDSGGGVRPPDCRCCRKVRWSRA
jgi:hypothetical protein